MRRLPEIRFDMANVVFWRNNDLRPSKLMKANKVTAFRIFTALVTFERTKENNSELPPEAQGACGYMAIEAIDEDDVFDTLRDAMRAVNLDLVDVNEITETSLEAFPEDLDEHLAENVRKWEPGNRTVWGTIHVYLADGEA